MKHTTMGKYDNGYDDENEDVNNDDNAASGSGSDVPIFNPITTPRSHGGGFGDDGDGAAATAHYVSTCCTKFIPYKDPIKDVT